MIKPLVFLFWMICVLSVKAQVDTVPDKSKIADSKKADSHSNTVLKKDTNTFTIINVVQPASKSSKNTKPLVKTSDEQSNDDVKTSIVKAKQNSQHWFDALYVNLICAGINKFVKND